MPARTQNGVARLGGEQGRLDDAKRCLLRPVSRAARSDKPLAACERLDRETAVIVAATATRAMRAKRMSLQRVTRLFGSSRSAPRIVRTLAGSESSTTVWPSTTESVAARTRRSSARSGSPLISILRTRHEDAAGDLSRVVQLHAGRARVGEPLVMKSRGPSARECPDVACRRAARPRTRDRAASLRPTRWAGWPRARHGASPRNGTSSVWKAQGSRRSRPVLRRRPPEPFARSRRPATRSAERALRESSSSATPSRSTGTTARFGRSRNRVCTALEALIAHHVRRGEMETAVQRMLAFAEQLVAHDPVVRLEEDDRPAMRDGDAQPLISEM